MSSSLRLGFSFFVFLFLILLLSEQPNEISETTSLALEEVRQIAHDLRPYQLERLGLTNTLEYILRYVRNSSDIDFETTVDDIDGLLSRESEINFYRVVQECINNIIKHSDATEASIEINRIENEINIICRDNGKGFDVRAIQHLNERGLGLTGLAERLSMLGGS